MSLFDLLNVARGGMQAAQVGIAVTSHNIANAATEGYTRQSVDLLSAGAHRMRGLLLGQGVKASDILRAFDAFTDARLARERSALSYADSLASHYASIETLFEGGLDASLDTRLNALFDAFAALSAAPEDGAVRAEALASAHDLASAFSETARALLAERDAANAAVPVEAAEASALAARIAELNLQIAAAESGGTTAADLRDERGRLVADLSAYAEVQAFEEPDGSLTVLIAGEALVEGGRAKSLEAAVDPATGLHRLSLVGSDGSSTDLTARLRTGSLGAHLEARDARIPELMVSLDQIAYDLVTSMNSVHAAGFGLDGATGRDLFEAPASVSGAALSMRLSADVEDDPDALAAAASADGLPGDGSVAAALAELAGSPVVLGADSPVDALAALFAAVGTQAQGAYADLEHRQAVVDEVQALRDSISGVSMEDESVNLIRFQDAYEASARVLTTVQEMLDTLLDL